MKIIYAESDFWEENLEFVEYYERVIMHAFKLARSKVSIIPEKVTFVCQTNDWECIPETGDGGFTRSSRLILLSLDPKLPLGEKKLLENVESTVFHELNHAARFEIGVFHETFIENCIMEGLASVYEHEYTKRRPLWSEYDYNLAITWYEEIKTLGDSVNYNQFMYLHPDGRRWIGYKVGTWITEEAMKNSNKIIEELTLLNNDEILKLAKL